MQPAHLDMEKLSTANGAGLVTRLSGKLSLMQVAGLAKVLPIFPTVEAALSATS